MSADWPRVPLGEVLTHRKEFIQIDDLQPYKRCRVQLHAQGVVLRDEVPGTEIKTKKQQVCQAGEFLVAEIDAKLGGFGIVPPELEGAIVSSHYFLFPVIEAKLDRRFLDYFIRTPDFRDQVTAQGSTNYAAIRPSHVLGYTMPLPPLAEQRRIVSRVDAIAARIADARRLREEATSESEALAGSALGRFFATIAERFGTQLLGDLSVYITDGPHLTPTYFPTGIPFVTVKNMVTGRLDFTELQYISPEDHAEFIRRCHPERGDVLYSKDGATRGRPCFVDTNREFSIFVSVALIKPKRTELDGKYLCYVLRSNWIRDRMQSKSRGDMIPHIVLREIRAFPIPLPPLAEQHSIVAHLDALQSRADALRTLQAEASAELDSLLTAVLAKAFAGGV